VQIRLRSRMSGAWAAALRAAAETPRPQRPRRAQPIDLALRVLRHPRPAPPYRSAADLCRRLRAQIQPLQTARLACRTNPSGVSPNPRLWRPSSVSHIVNPDTSLTGAARSSKMPAVRKAKSDRPLFEVQI